MKYLLDTNHWSYIQEQHPVVMAHIAQLPETASLLMPVVAQAELLAGIEMRAEGKRKAELRSLYESTLRETAEIIAIDSAIAEQFAGIAAQLKRAGRKININDIWIASIARAHNLTVATHDDHFQFVEGLSVEDWTKPAPA